RLCCVERLPVPDTDRVIRSGGSSAPAGYRFPRGVIAVAVRWYLRYGLSYRDVEELLAERGIDVDHVTVYRWVQTFTPEFIDAARPAPTQQCPSVTAQLGGPAGGPVLQASSTTRTVTVALDPDLTSEVRAGDGV